MYDLTRTRHDHVGNIPILTGNTINKAGGILVGELEDGVIKAKLSAGSSGEKVLGFSSFYHEVVSEHPVCEDVVVPADPWEVQLTSGDLPIESAFNMKAASMRAEEIGGSAFTVIYTGSPTAGQVLADIATGLLTFNSADEGKSIRCWYTRILTVNESISVFGQKHSNHPTPTLLNEVGIMDGQGEIFTYEYDTTKDYSNVSAGDLKSGADGKFTVGGSGTAFGIVTKVPTPEDPYLGVKYTAPNLQ